MDRHRHRPDTAPVPPRTKTRGGCLVCCREKMVPAVDYPGLVSCPSCGFLSFGNALSAEEVNALYGRDYFHGEEYLDYRLEEISLRRNFRRRLETILSVLPDTGKRRLFEIGCAYGFFLDEARKHFDSVSGMDISDVAVKFARDRLDVDAIEGDYLGYDLPGPVDAIYMWDVVEHLTRPDLVLEKAARELRPGGIVCITTGDVGSLNARLRKNRWRMIHPPTHLHYFSVPTITRLLGRFGLEIVGVTHPGVSHSVGMILFGILSLGLGRPDLYHRLPRLGILDLHVSLNLFDIMFVIARKTGA